MARYQVQGGTDDLGGQYPTPYTHLDTDSLSQAIGISKRRRNYYVYDSQTGFTLHMGDDQSPVYGVWLDAALEEHGRVE